MKDFEVIDNVPNTYIADSAIHGRGLFAVDGFEYGDTIATLDGQIMDWDQYDRLRSQVSISECDKDYLFFEWNALAVDTLLVRPFRTKYSFINHSHTPNLKIIGKPLASDQERLLIVAIDDIKPDEELTLDYRQEPLRDQYLQGHGATYLQVSSNRPQG